MRVTGYTVSATFTFLIMILLIAAMYTTREWSFQARLFPWTIGIPAIALCLLQLMLDLFKKKTDADEDQGIMDLQVDRSVPPEQVVRRAANIFGWILALFGSIWLLGFIISLPLFVCSYLTFQSRENLWSSLSWTLFTLVFMLGLFHYILRAAWSEPLIPWPQEVILSWL